MKTYVVKVKLQSQQLTRLELERYTRRNNNGRNK